MRTPLKLTNHSPQGREIIPQQQIIGLIQSADPFPIDFDIAWKWCGYSRKQRALDKLKGHFIQDTDFLPKWVKTSSPNGGRPFERIMLSIDCFKAFSMMAGTDKGKDIRAYFISCEKELLAIKNQSKEEVTIKKQITGRVKKLRKAHGINQTEIGKLLGMTLSGVSAKEQHISSFSVLELRKIKSRFNTTYDYLIDGDEERLSPGSFINNSVHEDLKQKHICMQEKVILLQDKLLLVLEGKPLELKEPAEKYFTILTYAIKNHLSLNKKEATLLGMKAASLCRDRDIEIKRVPNETYGEVGSYPANILKEVFTLNN